MSGRGGQGRSGESGGLVIQKEGGGEWASGRSFMVVRNILDSRVARKGFSKLEMRGEGR